MIPVDLKFKTESLGALTPKVLLSQCNEIEWEGLMVIGYCKVEGLPGVPTGKKGFAFQMAGVTEKQFQQIARFLDHEASKQLLDEFNVSGL